MQIRIAMWKDANLLSLFQKVAFAFLVALSFIALVLLYSNATIDGDIYFHTAYGKEILKHKSLTIDENDFTWVHYSDVGLYPAWIPQVSFYLLYKLGGEELTYIYSLRILLLFFMGILLFVLAYEAGVSIRIAFLYLLLLMLMLSRNGMMLKADMFSAPLFSALVFVYYFAKLTGRLKILWVIPFITLIWANSHIAVVIGWGTILIMAFVEFFLNANRRLGKRLFLMWLLSSLTLFITPKPFFYARFIASKFVGKALLKVLGIASNEPLAESAKHIIAFSPLKPNMNSMYFLGFLFGLISIVLVFVALAYPGLKRYWESRDKDSLIEALKSCPWDLLVLGLVFAKLSLSFGRFIYTFGIFSAFSLTYWLRGLKWKSLGWYLVELVSVIFVYFLLVGCIERIPSYTYVGDGPWVPVRELEFLKKNLPGGPYKMINSYGVGSYVMLKGYPKFKVFIDTRMGKHFMDYYNMSTGRYEKMGIPIQKVLEEADVALISYTHWGLLWTILNQPDWRPVYWDTGGVALVKKGVAPGLGWHDPDWDKFRREFVLFRYTQDVMLRFLLYTGHVEQCKKVLEIAKEVHKSWYDGISEHMNTILLAESDYHYGYRTYIGSLNALERMPSVYLSTVLFLARKHAEDLYEEGEYRLALNWERLIFRFAHRLDINLFNQGVNLYHLGQKVDAKAYLVGSINSKPEGANVPYPEFVNCVLTDGVNCENYPHGFWDDIIARTIGGREDGEDKEKE